jgi:hypothetical protein
MRAQELIYLSLSFNVVARPVTRAGLNITEDLLVIIAISGGCISKIGALNILDQRANRPISAHLNHNLLL